MNDENKEPMVDRKKGAEQKTQLSQDALSSVAGGTPPDPCKKLNALSEEELDKVSGGGTISLNYGEIKVEYKPQKDDGTL